MIRIQHALLAALATTSCSTPFGYSVDMRGGWDRADESDQIYFVAQRVQGLAPDVNALIIPEGWRERTTQPVSPGVKAITPSLQLDWLAGAENLPDAGKIVTQGLAVPDLWKGPKELSVFVASGRGKPFPELGFAAHNEIHDQLVDGGDAYAIVPDGRFLKNGFVVFGAVGPPLSWVRIGEVTVESREGPFAWGLARSLGAVAYALDYTAYPVGYTLGLATFWAGGLAVFELEPEVLEPPW